MGLTIPFIQTLLMTCYIGFVPFQNLAAIEELFTNIMFECTDACDADYRSL